MFACLGEVKCLLNALSLSANIGIVHYGGDKIHKNVGFIMRVFAVAPLKMF